MKHFFLIHTHTNTDTKQTPTQTQTLNRLTSGLWYTRVKIKFLMHYLDHIINVNDKDEAGLYYIVTEI